MHMRDEVPNHVLFIEEVLCILAQEKPASLSNG